MNYQEKLATIGAKQSLIDDLESKRSKLYDEHLAVIDADLADWQAQVDDMRAEVKAAISAEIDKGDESAARHPAISIRRGIDYDYDEFAVLHIALATGMSDLVKPASLVKSKFKAYYKANPGNWQALVTERETITIAIDKDLRALATPMSNEKESSHD